MTRLRPHGAPAPVGAACVALALVFGACSPGTPAEGDQPQTEARSQAVVYGADDRVEVFEHPDPTMRNLAVGATAAMISNRAFDIAGDRVTLYADSLGEAYGLCPGELFADQPSLANCSGTLIDDDLILTAGHCVEGGCGGVSWLFDYHYVRSGQLAEITADDVYGCAEVLIASPNLSNPSGPDMAIVRLDRVATPGRTPAALHSAATPVSVGQSVTLIGYGSGLPAKIDGGGRVLSISGSSTGTFSTTSDAFGGHSGSGVFDTNGQVVGILVAGAEDYEYDGHCVRVARQPASGGTFGGEEVTYASLARAALCDSGYPSERLCNVAPRCGDGLCSGSERHDSCPTDCRPDAAGAWTCEASYYGSLDGCDCECGTRDPDCDVPGQRVFNCPDGWICGSAGDCVDDREPDVERPEPPAAWTCDNEVYDAADGCDCECGTWDPDCDDPSSVVYNCVDGDICAEDAHCETPTAPSTPDAGADVGVPEESDDVGIVPNHGWGEDSSCSVSPTPSPGGGAAFTLTALGLFLLRRRRL